VKVTEWPASPRGLRGSSAAGALVTRAADAPIEECGPHVSRLAESCSAKRHARADVANDAAGALYRFVLRFDVGSTIASSG